MSAFALAPEKPRLPGLYRNEAAVVEELLETLRGDALDWSAVVSLARPWIEQVRAHPAPFWALESLLQEFPISSNEGLALMRLAEALLRVPDKPTAIALTSDQLGRAEFAGSWSASAISLAKKILPDAEGAGGIFSRLGSETVVAATMRALHLLGRQFVLGRTIQEAINKASRARQQHHSLRFSYDMLGEGARTDADARRYHAAYLEAIQALSEVPGSADGISIKLSALCARYEELQRRRVAAELLPRLWLLIEYAARANINLTIDAEEVDRLELSLDLLEAMAQRVSVNFPDWRGLGLAVQAYQTRAISVIHEVAAIAHRYHRHFRVRLVKGAYWDTEIKRAQELGVAAYPVFTHKQYTDVSYLACANVLLGHADVIYPQFASHNAATIAAVLQMAKTARVDFELQRLHGMGEALYREVLDDPSITCRVYAPVGQHKDLLAYLVRRLLENGANSSFIHQLTDPALTADELLVSPLTPLQKARCLPLPCDLYRDTRGQGRANSSGLDLADFYHRAQIQAALETVNIPPCLDSCEAQVNAVMESLSDGFPLWNAVSVSMRATVLRVAADLLQAQLPQFCALLVNEAFKTAEDAIAEVREAIDFLRYYAAQAELLNPLGRGVFVCISPWNFPLAIFTGQIAAALVAGNAVAAKPAEQTPAVATKMVQLLYQAGAPENALQILYGTGEDTGAALVSHDSCAGVCFTGSTQVAHIINRMLAQKPGPAVPLIAETGGINAMLVDSTALPEQVVDAVVQSAFHSAGQRCSALRLLCVHESVADSVIDMLAGAMQVLSVGAPSDLSVDVGPLIDEEAYSQVAAQIMQLRREATLISETPRPDREQTGVGRHIITPVAFQIKNISQVADEIFGPVLQVVRWQGEPEAVIAQINALGYGLTLGIQTRIDSRARRLASAARVGNVYVNRNMTGAVVGVQPFGGEGMSGTGPKAGGPFYLRRFASPTGVTGDAAPGSGLRLASQHVRHNTFSRHKEGACQDVDSCLREIHLAHEYWSRLSVHQRSEIIGNVTQQLATDSALLIQQLMTQASSDFAVKVLPGPTGETNELSCRGRGMCLILSVGAEVDAQVITAAVAGGLLAGNAALVIADHHNKSMVCPWLSAWSLAGLPTSIASVPEGGGASLIHEVLVSVGERLGVVVLANPEPALAREIRQQLAQRSGAIVPVISAGEACDPMQLYRYATEQVLSINTAAAGGNAELLSGHL